MRKIIEQKIVQINKATGAEIIIRADDTWLMHTCTNRIKKNAIIPENFSTITSEEKLSSRLSSAVPLSVVINGKGVLTKMIPASSQKDNPFASVLPGANPSDFYFETYTVSNNSVISIIRKGTADAILNRLKETGIKVLSVSFGFSQLSSILSYLQAGSSKEIDTASFAIQLDEQGRVVDFKLKNEISDADPGIQPEYLVAEQYIKAYRLLSFAASVNLLADNISLPAAVSSELVAEERKDYKYYKYFRFAGLALLATLFVVLLSSFLVYSHYFELNNKMQSTQSLTDLQNKKTRKTEMDITQKEKFLSRSGWVSQSRTSYYADRIAALTPGDIMLKTMNVYPVKTGSFNEDGSILCKKDTIDITGICYDPVVLNQFISGLKIIPDFSKVTVKNYQYRKEDEAGAFSMEVITKQ